MSKNIDMVGLIDELGSLVQKIKEGTATRGEIEAFASAASELHERAVVLRYKAYELQVFGERSVPSVVQEVPTSQVAEVQEEIVAVSEVVDMEVTEISSSDLFQEETNESMDLFSFDLEEPVGKEEDEVLSFDSVFPELEAEIEEEAIVEIESLVVNEEVTQVVNADEIAPEVEAEETLAVEEEKEETEEPAHVWASTPETLMDFEEPTVISNNTWVEAPVESNFTSEPTVAAENSASQWEPTSSVEEVAPAPAAVTPEVPSFNSPIHPIYSRLRAEDASFAGRLMAIRLETLKGAFGLNERMQLVQTLFEGSNDAFIAAVDSLDSLATKEESRSYVTTIASRYNWSPDDPLAIEFVQKVERRYA